MALIWRSIIEGKRYEVRRAGASIRLYTNGVFHSQFNPDYPLGGNIWDLLVLPALFSPANVQHILVLGLGGGAFVRAIQTLLPQRHLTAVEIDPVHIRIAQRYFDVRPNGSTKIVKDDAVAWLKSYRGKPFDFILDDLFIETDGQPDRAIGANYSWCELLVKHLSSKGVLAINFDTTKTLRNSAFIKQRKLSKTFQSQFSLSIPGYDNRIAAFFKTPQTRERLKQNLSDLKHANGKGLSRRLNMHIRKL